MTKCGASRVANRSRSKNVCATPALVSGGWRERALIESPPVSETRVAGRTEGGVEHTTLLEARGDRVQPGFDRLEAAVEKAVG